MGANVLQLAIRLMKANPRSSAGIGKLCGAYLPNQPIIGDDHEARDFDTADYFRGEGHEPCPI